MRQAKLSERKTQLATMTKTDQTLTRAILDRNQSLAAAQASSRFQKTIFTG